MIEVYNNLIKKNANGIVSEITGALGRKRKGIHIPRGTTVDIPMNLDLTVPFTITFWLKCIPDNYTDLYSVVEFILNDDTLFSVLYNPYRESMIIGGQETRRGYTMYSQRGWYFVSITLEYGKVYYCIGGNLHSADNAVMITKPVKGVNIGRSSTFQNGTDYDNIYVDNLCIHFDRFYTESYTTPTKYFIGDNFPDQKNLYIGEDKKVFKVGD
jgi:hypothetical protein|nr:MAG TPA: hypothetical protein [Caudoviricetes sp.]